LLCADLVLAGAIKGLHLVLIAPHHDAALAGPEIGQSCAAIDLLALSRGAAKLTIGARPARATAAVIAAHLTVTLADARSRNTQSTVAQVGGITGATHAATTVISADLPVTRRLAPAVDTLPFVIAALPVGARAAHATATVITAVLPVAGRLTDRRVVYADALRVAREARVTGAALGPTAVITAGLVFAVGYTRGDVALSSHAQLTRATDTTVTAAAISAAHLAAA
jgi:hypothetical protein